MDAKKWVEELSFRWKSGNSIPVERAYLKKEEWDQLYDLLQHYFKLDESTFG